MNKKLLTTLKIFATVGFACMLACIAFDLSNRLELICCAVAAVFSPKRKNKYSTFF